MTTQTEFPSLGSGIINCTCWKVIDYFHANGLEYTTDTWNNLKPAMYEALKFFEQERNKEKQMDKVKEVQEKKEKQKTLNILKLQPNKIYRVVKGSSPVWIGAEVKLKELNEKEIVSAVKHGQQLVQLESDSLSKTESWYSTCAIEVIKSSPEGYPGLGVYFGVGNRLKFVEVE